MEDVVESVAVSHAGVIVDRVADLLAFDTHYDLIPRWSEGDLESTRQPLMLSESRVEGGRVRALAREPARASLCEILSRHGAERDTDPASERREVPKNVAQLSHDDFLEAAVDNAAGSPLLLKLGNQRPNLAGKPEQWNDRVVALTLHIGRACSVLIAV